MIGRTAEIAFLQRRIAEAGSGRGGTVVVRGEAGIGKSALLEEAARTAGDDLLVLRIIGVEAEADALAAPTTGLDRRPVSTPPTTSSPASRNAPSVTIAQEAPPSTSTRNGITETSSPARTRSSCGPAWPACKPARPRR
ncbi:AAA family ATPase [Nonomuraea sp. H19]|uniref:ATP-binding protein n=1 Tax=Nonomuraea sp. H19 TaxID=3452206 RepID=UPI003F8CE788